ncbi:MAG: hypothetical protein Q9206_000357 [Seirophora lacunosa]
MPGTAHVNAIKISTNGRRKPQRWEYFERRLLTSRLLTAAQYFVESYYLALNSHRDSITSFYMAAAEMPGGKPLPSISFNGNQIPNAAAMQTMFEQQMPPSHYEVQCYDCHVVNPNYVAEGTQGWPAKTGKNMTILVAVSGYVKYGNIKEAKPRGFNQWCSGQTHSTDYSSRLNPSLSKTSHAQTIKIATASEESQETQDLLFSLTHANVAGESKVMWLPAPQRTSPLFPPVTENSISSVNHQLSINRDLDEPQCFDGFFAIMRFVDSIAQCNATVTILADGRECPEYSIVGDEHGNLKCYIPLMPDQVISVQVAMDMTSEHFEVDLFTDGVIRNFWQSTRNSVNKHRAPSVEFTQGIYKYMRSLYRSSMTTTSIPESMCLLLKGSGSTAGESLIIA